VPFLTADTVTYAIRRLRNSVHPFLGITFLACKKASLPIGREKKLSLDSLTKDFLEEHHRLAPSSAYYFQPFKSIKYWIDQKYPSSGLQAINTQTFGDAFLHQRGSGWGFRDNYHQAIADRLRKLGYDRASLLDLAIWVYKDLSWDGSTVAADLLHKFITEFNITEEDRTELFDEGLAALLPPEVLFKEEQLDHEKLLSAFPPPPDAPPEVGGTLRCLRLEFVGPADGMEIEFGDRLTLITGDNGLGKSFLLESAWWATTGTWADEPLYPFSRDPDRAVGDTEPLIDFDIEDRYGRVISPMAKYDWSTNRWRLDQERQTLAALSVFAKADGSFALYDPVRMRLRHPEGASELLSQHDVWFGRDDATEGLVRDWIRWERADNSEPFESLKALLLHLSPDDLGRLQPGPAVRMPGSTREIPTILHRYGQVPVTLASAGVQRIMALAYLLVWAWTEHRVASELTGTEPLSKLIVFVDEIEAHLHPQWQRIVLPALLQVSKPFGRELDLQTIAATHSPLVVASMEPIFSASKDKLYHLDLEDGDVELMPLDFEKQGDIAQWLTSPAFGLRYARSKPAEKAIDRAKSLQLSEATTGEEVRRTTNELKRVLAPDDKFWPRWSLFAKRHGVEL
jgi:hypothetical protein